ncbi:MAG: ATP-binding protein, partial [Bacteroidota bacterium]
TRLGDFFRLTLAHDHRATVPLREEVAFCRAYLRIEQDRLEERLRVEVEMTPEAADASVPYLLLQPLVENALRHGIGTQIDGGTVSIRGRRERDVLVVEVENTGPRLGRTKGDRTSGGIGLANTRERLYRAHGDRASLTLSDTEAGVCARLVLPFEPVAPAEPPAAAPSVLAHA